MSRRKPIEDKIKELEAMGYHIQKKGKSYIVHHEKKNADNPLWLSFGQFGTVPVHTYTLRQLHRFYKGHFDKPKIWKKEVKKLSNSKDRTAKRKFISHEDFDNIPSNKPIKKEDSWYHD